MRSVVSFTALLLLLVVAAAARSGAQGTATPPASPAAQGQPPAGAAPGPGQAPAAPKNLKVLPKDWTVQQVRALMATFMESLGLKNSGAPGDGCDHCHAANPAVQPAPGRGPTLDYSLDTNPKKDIARKMIQMVMATNEQLKTVADPPVNEPVSCFTCHRGDSTSKPLAAPANGWTRGGFTLLPPGPVVGRGRGMN
jgi:hypothetical protein